MKLPIDKKQFCTYIDKIITAHKYQSEVEKIVRKWSNKIETDFMSFQGLAVDFECDLVNILDTILETDWVSYYIYECDYGSDVTNRITDNNGKNIPITTPGELFDLICSK